MNIALSGTDLRITTSLIGPVLEDIATYKAIEIVGKLGDTKTVSLIKLLPIVPQAGDTATFDSTGITIKPLFFGSDTLVDGVYSFTIKYIKQGTNGLVVESNCLFLDVTLSCSISQTLNQLVEESKDGTLEPTSSMIHLLHYGLTNGSNCGCNCDDMIEAFKELKRLLTGVDPQLIANCGC
jgi:hypothetical protein